MIKLSSKYICALDIGSSKIACVLVSLNKKRINSIFFENVNFKGLKNGVVVDAIETINAVTGVVKRIKDKSGINVKLICVNICGQDVISKHSRAITPLAERGNKIITIFDIQRVNEQARILGSSLDEEIIHTIPSSYTIDSKSNIINPIGLYSHKLEADLYLICAKLSSVQSLDRIITQTGCQIKDIFVSGFAASKVSIGDDFKEGTNLFCDIGADTTELLIFRNGILRDIEVLPLGGDDFTRQLSDALKIPFDLAEDIKKSHGIITDSLKLKDEKEILVKKSNFYKPIKQKEVVEIVSSSAKLISNQIKEAIEKKVSLHEVNNLVVSGRTALLEGFIEMLEGALNIPVKLARVNNAEILDSLRENSEISGQTYLNYLTCLGMIAQEFEGKSLEILPNNAKPAKGIFFKALNRIKEVYQEYF